MSDRMIVERLRYKDAVVESDNTLCDEAADEIERLTAENAALRSRLADYELLKRAVNETGDCLPDCDSYAHNEQCPNVNNHVVLQDKQREIESLRSRLAEDEKLYDELNNDYVLVRNNRDEIARELGETNEALAACQSQGAGLQARLAEAVELLASARGKIDTLTIQGKGCQRDIDAFLAREEKP